MEISPGGSAASENAVPDGAWGVLWVLGPNKSIVVSERYFQERKKEQAGSVINSRGHVEARSPLHGKFLGCAGLESGAAATAETGRFVRV